MRDSIWVLFAVMFAGQMMWLLSAAACEKWLRDHDPSFQPPGVAARFFLGRLITSFGPMNRYATLRRERNEPTPLVAVFWLGFAISVLAVVGIFASLG